MSNNKNSKKVVLVTGASQGLGKEIVRKLSCENYHCILISRNTKKLQAVSESLKNSSIFFECDLENPDHYKNTIQEIKKHLKESFNKKLYGLINNAGIFIRKSFEETTRSEWQKLLQINLIAPVDFSKSFIAELENSKGSHIINIASTAGIRPVSHTAAYSATKSALISISQNMALELASKKIRVNCISPGIINTAIHSLEKLSKAERKKWDKLQPLDRVGEPKDIGSMVSFLLKEENNWITGSHFVIDGGITLL